jgi:hypothetical protein
MMIISNILMMSGEFWSGFLKTASKHWLLYSFWLAIPFMYFFAWKWIIDSHFDLIEEIKNKKK